MKQFVIEDNKLTLLIKKSPFLVRLIFFPISFLFFILPIGGMVAYLVSGNEFHIGFLFGIFISSLLGIYMLRITLWNTFGKEVIIFNNSKVTYTADYGWFKDSLKSKVINSISFSILNVGYEEDNTGVLFIGDKESNIESVAKLPINELEDLIKELKIIN